MSIFFLSSARLLHPCVRVRLNLSRHDSMSILVVRSSACITFLLDNKYSDLLKTTPVPSTELFVLKVHYLLLFYKKKLEKVLVYSINCLE